MKRNPRFTGLHTGLCIAVIWMLFGGCDKIEPGTFTVVEKAPFTPAQTAVAELRETDRVYEAVGTVRPKTETRIEARVTGQVLDVRVSPGDPVAKGNLLISLDSRQMTSRLDQAKQALKTAEAGHEQARHALEGAQAGFQTGSGQLRSGQALF
jgi:HlyD family secretion protein